MPPQIEFEELLGKTIKSVKRVTDETIEVLFTDGTTAMIGACSLNGEASVDFG